MIFETIVITTDVAGNPHVTPFGIQREKNHVIISPFRPSATLDNVLATKSVVVNFTDDVRVFAGALTGRKAWQLKPASLVQGFVLEDVLAHQELMLVDVLEDNLRPQLIFDIINTINHKPFQGYNRAQAAVIELAVLASRLHMLPVEKIKAEMQYLQIAIDKTAGERELEAWSWLIEKIENYETGIAGNNLALRELN